MRRGIEALRALLRLVPSTPARAHSPRIPFADPPALRGWRRIVEASPIPSGVASGGYRRLSRWARTGDGGWTRTISDFPDDRADDSGRRGDPRGPRPDRHGRHGGGHRRRDGRDGGRDGRSQSKTPGPSREHIQLNGDLANARGVDALLAIVDTRGADMNVVNVATAVSSLWKQAKREARDHGVAPSGGWEFDRGGGCVVGAKLSADPRLPKLLRLVREKSGDLHARGVSGVMHGLGVLHADLRALPVSRWTAAFEKSFTAKLGDSLSRRVEATASDMNAQEVAIAYNACAKYDALGERLTPGAWRALADTIHMRADEFTAQGLAMTLNAMSKTPAMEATAAASVPPGGWTSLARAVTRLFPPSWVPADDGDMQSVAVTFNALAKLDFASLAVASEDGWSVLVAAAVKCAGTKSGKGKLGFDGQALAMVLNAFANCHAASHELAATKGGWRAFDDNFVAAASRGPQRVVMNMQGACMVLNATWKLIKDHGVSMTPAFRRVAADFASRIADDVPPKTTGLLINSLAKLKGVAAEVPPDGWARIAQCVHRTYASVGDANFERDREKMRTSTEGNEGYIERFVDGGFEVGQFDGDELTATFQSVCACDLLVDQLTDDTWRVIANAVADFARTGAMSPDSVFATATSYNALRRRAPGALAAASDADLWRPLARCALDRLDDMNPIFVIHTLDAAKKLPEFRGALDVEPGAWGKLAKRLGETANELDVVNTVNAASALGWMPSLASNMSDSGWHVVLYCLRQYEAIVVDKARSLEAARSHGHDISDIRAAETKYAEKSLAGLLLIRAHEETYGTAVMAKIAECIERIEGKVDEETRAKVHARFDKSNRR